MFLQEELGVQGLSGAGLIILGIIVSSVASSSPPSSIPPLSPTSDDEDHQSEENIIIIENKTESKNGNEKIMNTSIDVSNRWYLNINTI